MFNLPDNSIANKLNLLCPVKTISISTPDKPNSALMVQIKWDAGLDMRVPELEIPDISSADAIIEQRKAVTVSGWSRLADTYILLEGISWDDPAIIEQWVSEIGWRLGAGYMYRWQHSPGDPYKHLWGLVRYQVMGDDLYVGDASEELSQLSEEYGCWEWEINASYRKMHGHSAIFWPEWYRCDPSLNEDGGRSAPFPGWDGHHPWLRDTSPHTGYESHYFFCPTYRGKGQNKRLFTERGACYIKNLKWKMREKED